MTAIRLTVEQPENRDPGSGMPVTVTSDIDVQVPQRGADVEAVCREAATIAVREHVQATAAGEDSDVDAIDPTVDHFEQALDEVDASGDGSQPSGVEASAV